MKTIIKTLILLTSITNSFAQQTISLSNCQQWARVTHPYYANFEQIEQSNALKQANLNTQHRPQVYVNGQATYQTDAISISMPDFANWTPPQTPRIKSISADKDQYKLTLDVNQVIYDGGVTKWQTQVNKTTADIEKYITETELQKLKEQVNILYFTILILNENQNLLKTVSEVLLNKQKLVYSAVTNGTLQQNDIEVINIEILKNNQQLLDVQISITNNKAILSQLIGKPLSDSTIFELPEVNLQSADSLKRPEIKMFELQRNNFNLMQQTFKAQSKPKLNLFAQAGYGKPGLNMLKNEFAPYGIVGVVFKWNIWDWNKTGREKQLLAIQSNMVTTKQQAFEKNINISRTTIKNRILQLENALKTDTEIWQMRKNITQRSVIKLKQGIITATDYINDLNAETQADIQLKTHQIQLIQEKMNYVTLLGN